MALPRTAPAQCTGDWNELTRNIVAQRFERVSVLLKNGADVNFTTPVCTFFFFFLSVVCGKQKLTLCDDGE